MWERAAELGALLVFAEHRYYGESLPFGGSADKYNASALRWLSLEQALADYATLIYELKLQLNATSSPVVALGGSYGGMVAAWLRMHYPAAVVGALAASAPVLAFDGMLSPSGVAQQFDGNSFWQVVTADASTGAGAAAGCVEGVRATWPHLFEMMKTADGRAALEANFGLCSPLSAGDGGRLSSQLLNVWDTLAMGNYPYPSNYLVFQQTQDPSIKLPAWPMRAACEPFAGATAATPRSTLLQAMATAAGVLYNASGRLPCLALPTDPNYDGIWDYQWCTERLPQETYFTLDGVRDMFWSRPANRTAVAAKCAAKYGVGTKGSWIASSSSFAAAGATNIIFSNGEYDPWRAGGVLTNRSESIVAIEVPPRVVPTVVL